MPCCCVHYLIDFVFLPYRKIFGSRFMGFSAHMWRGGLNFGPIWLINLPSQSTKYFIGNILYSMQFHANICKSIFHSEVLRPLCKHLSIFVKIGIYFFPCCSMWFSPVSLDHIGWGINVFRVIQLLFKYLDERTMQINSYIYRGLELRYFTFVLKCV